MAFNEKSKENLKPSEPGMTNNPTGRPKGVKNRATILKEIFSMKIKTKNPLKDDKVQKMTVEQIINIAQAKKAMDGDSKAYELVTQAVYGKIPIDVNLGGQEDNPIVVDKKVTEMSPLQLFIFKYGEDSDEVRKFREKYPEKSE